MKQKNESELTETEFKELVCKLAVALAPEVLKRVSNDEALDRNVALFSYDVAEATRAVLKDRHSNRF